MTMDWSLEGSALLIIDMMNDHIHLEGTATRYFGGLTPEHRAVIVGNNVRILKAARAKGLPVAMIMYTGEGHGFRRAETIVSAIEAQVYFLGRVFGHTPADDVPAIPIDNLPGETGAFAS